MRFVIMVIFLTKWRMVGSNHLPEATVLQTARASNALNTLRIVSVTFTLSCSACQTLFSLLSPEST